MTIQTLAAAMLLSLSSVVCSFAAVDPGLLALVPENSQFIVGVDVAASRNSDLGQYLSARIHPEDKGFEQFITETGFDPRHDLVSVVFAGTTGASGRHDTPGVLLARGTFDQNRIRNAALAKGVVIQSFSGVDFYIPSSGGQKNAFAFLQNNLFATGSVQELQQVVARRSSTSRLDPQLQQLVTQAGTDNDIWFASTVPASRFAAHFQSEMNQSAGGSQALQAISAASGGLRFGSSVQVTLDAIARSEKDASSIADVVRFVASLVQTKTQSDPNGATLSAALNQMLVSATGQNVHLSLSLPETMLEQLTEARLQPKLLH